MNVTALNELIEVLRQIDDSPTSECGFSMNVTAHNRMVASHPCGTACCIGGWAWLALTDRRPRYANNPDTLLEDLLSISQEDSEKIAYPQDVYGNSSAGWRATPNQAAALLEHFRDTGEVDWALAMEPRS